MRELHKWKEKVEFSLDNRQVLFLFFGLFVVGAFIFALGMLTGRRMEWSPAEQSAALADRNPVHSRLPTASLAEGRGRDAAKAGAGEDAPEEFAFRDALRESTASNLPRTRAPDQAPRDEKIVRAERRAAEKRAREDAARQAKAKREEERKRKAKSEIVIAGRSDRKAGKNKSKKRSFTLMLKSFSRRSDAQKLADRLSGRGHKVRVETREVSGRTWYSVRLGHYSTWDLGLSAKAKFEKSEQIIAFLVAE